ncbi:hypothetical protein JXL21_02015 [Candidatus Bathyarchaeota archaeon]|nr:hypothetical protein [Candidatus Bathyarchaeota archaeon]
MKGDRRTLNSLIRKADEYFETRKVNVVHAISIKNSYTEKALLRNGWIKNPANIAVSYNTQDIDEEDLEQFKQSTPDQINFQYGTTDWI